MEVGILSQTEDFTYDDILLMNNMLSTYKDTLNLFLNVFNSEEQFLKFLDLFAGRTITLPSRSRIFFVLLNIEVYRFYQEHKNDPEVLRKTAKRFNMTTQRVTDIVERVTNKL